MLWINAGQDVEEDLVDPLEFGWTDEEEEAYWVGFDVDDDFWPWRSRPDADRLFLVGCLLFVFVVLRRMFLCWRRMSLIRGRLWWRVRRCIQLELRDVHWLCLVG